MENFNQALFLWLNAPAQPPPALLALALFCARDLVWLMPALFIAAWLYGGAALRRALLQAAAAVAVGLCAAWAIGALWPHPRPFMLGLGHSLLPHAPDASFPSDHLTFWWSASFALAADRRCRAGGVLLAALGLAIAWARIYLGVHFPLDMAGAALVAAVSAWLARSAARWYLAPAYRLVHGVYGRLFGRLIARGWVRG